MLVVAGEDTRTVNDPAWTDVAGVIDVTEMVCDVTVLGVMNTCELAVIRLFRIIICAYPIGITARPTESDCVPSAPGVKTSRPVWTVGD